VCPNAGEPKGFGEMDVALRVEGIECRPGDWVVGDADGVIVLPARRAVEIANRAMYCLEAENRIRAEIGDGDATLAQVVELYKWEKRVLGGEGG
jgi:3-hexulose-6-phosphate synthase/6-phospho-3-hexuloisomerase